MFFSELFCPVRLHDLDVSTVAIQERWWRKRKIVHNCAPHPSLNSIGPDKTQHHDVQLILRTRFDFIYWGCNLVDWVFIESVTVPPQRWTWHLARTSLASKPLLVAETSTLQNIVQILLLSCLVCFIPRNVNFWHLIEVHLYTYDECSAIRKAWHKL